MSCRIQLCAEDLKVATGISGPLSTSIWGFPKIRGTIFRGFHKKDCSILGSIWGSPYFGKLPYNLLFRQRVCLRDPVLAPQPGKGTDLQEGLGFSSNSASECLA